MKQLAWIRQTRNFDDEIIYRLFTSNTIALYTSWPDARRKLSDIGRECKAERILKRGLNGTRHK
jgi:hypothetical protein